MWCGVLYGGVWCCVVGMTVFCLCCSYCRYGCGGGRFDILCSCLIVLLYYPLFCCFAMAVLRL